MFFEWLVLSLVVIIVATIVLSSKALDPTATVMSIVFGVIIFYLRGGVWLFVLFLFLAVSIYATHRLHKNKDEEHEVRGLDNVISNGLVAFMSAVFGFPYMYLGSISAALADTLSSEIGAHSKEQPRMITDLKTKVPKGTNGGITITGLIAAVIGAAIIGAAAFFFASSFYLEVNRTKLFLAVFVAGVLGSLIDSVLGAVFENKKQMTNGSVNFTATLTAAITAKLLMFL
ncbi:MAG: DUF92 domain-containing protein [Candidatus Aenigmarchaeota archaeon]|nr:DUF92 domain-containing protein [Candidatus Aenigmarchaeota archaeon]